MVESWMWLLVWGWSGHSGRGRDAHKSHLYNTFFALLYVF